MVKSGLSPMCQDHLQYRTAVWTDWEEIENEAIKIQIHHFSCIRERISYCICILSQQELNQQDNVLYQKVTKFVNIVIDSLPASDGYLKELKVTKQ